MGTSTPSKVGAPAFKSFALAAWNVQSRLSLATTDIPNPFRLADIVAVPENTSATRAPGPTTDAMCSAIRPPCLTLLPRYGMAGRLVVPGRLAKPEESPPPGCRGKASLIVRSQCSSIPLWVFEPIVVSHFDLPKNIGDRHLFRPW